MDSHSKEMAGATIDDLGQPTLVDLHQEIAQLRVALNQSQALWQATFDEAAIGMVHMALDCRWVRVNQHFCAMLGYQVDELLAKTIQEITHPDDWLGNAVGMQQLAAGEIQRYVTNKRYVHRNGNLVWGRLTLRLARASEDSPAYFVAVIEDITALKQAEDALRVSEERHRHILETQVDPICRFGVDCRLTFVNEPYAALYGQRPAELLGKSMLDIVPPQYHGDIAIHLSSLSKAQPVLATENPAYLADGSLHWFHWSNRLIELPDGALEYQGVGRDITDRKQAEDAEHEQRQLAEAMRDSLAALTSSLDVKQVMTQILSSAATVVPSDTGSIILVEGSYGRVAYSRGFSPEIAAALQQNRFAIDTFLNLRNAFAQNASYVVFDTRIAEDWCAFPATSWIRSSIGTPIRCNGQVIGLLTADSATPNFFQAKTVETLQTFAHYAGLALNNAYQATRLEQSVVERTAELQTAKEQVEDILNHSRDAILLVHPDLHIIQSNAIFDKLFSTNEADQQGESLLAFIHPDDHPLVHDGIALIRHKEGNHHVQIRACRRDGRRFDAELSISLLDESGFVCTLRDITERKERERQLLYYASIQESVTEAVIAVDLDYKIQSWNKAAETIFGWRAAEVVGQTTSAIFRTLYPSEENREALRQNILEQGYWQGEVIQHGKDGTPRNISASITLLRDAQGVSLGMVGILRDITEQKQMAMALNESQRFTEQMVATAPSIIYVYDLRTQNNTYINNNVTTVLGYSVEEFSTIGQRLFSDVIHPDDVGLFVGHIKQLHTAKDGEVFTLEHRMRHKNGSWRWFLMQDTIFQRSVDGVPTQILGVVADITAEKQAIESLRQQHDFLQQIIDQMPAIIMVKDQAGHFQLVNKHAAHVYGTTPATMIGKTDADVNPDPTEVMFFRQKDQEAFSSGEPIFTPEQTILGTYYRINKIPLKNEAGGIDRLLVVAVDISTHKQAEVALAQALQTEKELNEHKSRFITTTSHEFRTPLAVILSLTETLTAYRHKLPDEQIAQRLIKIKQQIEHLTTMMADVLELERIRTDEVSFTPIDLNPSVFCEELITDYQQVFSVTQRLVYQADKPMSLVKLDNRLLHHILTNILSNAVKYSPPDSTILFTVTQTREMLNLQIYDEGIGIPLADIKHLFKPFYRASNVENIPGTGLGLSIVQEAVTLHGGTISVESEVGKGSTFTVQLPVTSH